MFYDKFIQLCNAKNISPSRAAIEAGISKSLVSKWKNNHAKTPSADVARKFADYFGVTMAELLGEEQKEKAPILTAKDERDIARELENTLNLLGSADNPLMFDGEPLDDETRELLRASLENQIRMAKVIAKQKYTPKKYRKGTDAD